MEACTSDNTYQHVLRNHPLYDRLKRKPPDAVCIPLKRFKTEPEDDFVSGPAAASTAAAATAASRKPPVIFTILGDGSDDDDFSLTDLDNPDLPSPWEPIPVPKAYHRWKVGDTVEVAAANKGEFSDFAMIVGTNEDGTYNLHDILTQGWKKCVQPHRILGTYEDLVDKGDDKGKPESNSKLKSKPMVKSTPKIKSKPSKDGSEEEDSSCGDAKQSSDEDSDGYGEGYGYDEVYGYGYDYDYGGEGCDDDRDRDVDDDNDCEYGYIEDGDGGGNGNGNDGGCTVEGESCVLV